MNWFTAFVLYTLIWWVVLFAVLPIGIHPEAAPDTLTGWRGAPRQPRLGRKLLITTIVAGLIWALAVGLILSPWLNFRTGWLAIPPDR